MSNKRSRAAFESSDNDRPPAHAPYVLYGTPLPPYDPDARDDGSYVPVWKQEVTDEHGRKRLHGAFTGGWSAGYFNTVGSKEGWAPASFVSSRTNRAKTSSGQDGRAQKVEDFMDEEDLAELAESQKLETQGAFAGLGSGGADGAGHKSEGMFADLFRPTGDTIGVKLLQRMGWKQGQGIGPKVRRRIRGDEKGETHLMAPEDSKTISFHHKTDRKGIGFAGEERLDSRKGTSAAASDEEDQDARILQANRTKIVTKPKKLKKASFGVGVLNDTGSDEEDDYDMGPKISYNRVIGGDRKKKATGLGSSNPNVQKPVLTSKKLAQRTSTLTGFRKCHDGRLPIEGFVLSLAPLSITQENKYPPPAPPEGWKPGKQATSNQPQESSKPYQSTADAAKASTLGPKSRAALLGEQQLPGKSIFDFMTPAAREKLAAASGKTNLPPALGEGAPAGFVNNEAEQRKTLWDLIPPLDKDVARAALQRGSSGWMPYAEDEEKRSRYRYLIELRAGVHSHMPDRPKGFSIDEWAKELREFAQAAVVFKPVSGLMASRFTSSSSSTARLASDAPGTASASGSGSGKEEDPAEKAAKMGMYGPMTRSRLPFFPTRLLCKRFSVRPPANVAGDPRDGGAEVVEESKRLDVVSQASLDRMMQEASFPPKAGSGFVSGGTEGGEETGNVLRRQEWATVDAERNEALEGPRAGDDVFKAVFGDENDS